MNDLIWRQDIINIIKKKFPADYCDDGSNPYSEGYGDALNDIGISIRYLQPAELKQKMGHWYDVGSLSCRCSECGCKSPKEFQYCPNCGAKMEK